MRGLMSSSLYSPSRASNRYPMSRIPRYPTAFIRCRIRQFAPASLPRHTARLATPPDGGYWRSFWPVRPNGQSDLIVEAAIEDPYRIGRSGDVLLDQDVLRPRDLHVVVCRQELGNVAGDGDAFAAAVEAQQQGVDTLEDGRKAHVPSQVRRLVSRMWAARPWE